jgi:4-carboxymuconolactone decarboxylase
MTESSAERMWKDTLATLKDTAALVDEEFRDLTFDNVFGELYGREDHLDLKTRELCIISMLTALHHPEELKTHLTAAFNLGWTVEEIRDLMIISVLTGGWPAAVDSIRKLVEWRLERNLSIGDPGQRRENYETTDWYALGLEKCRALFGAEFDKLAADFKALNPDLEQWAIGNLYGKLLTRTRLDDRTRELCLVAAYAAQRSPRRLKLHIRGALNSGAAPEAVAELMFQVGLYAGQGATDDAMAVFRELMKGGA